MHFEDTMQFRNVLITLYFFLLESSLECEMYFRFGERKSRVIRSQRDPPPLRYRDGLLNPD